MAAAASVTDGAAVEETTMEFLSKEFGLKRDAYRTDASLFGSGLLDSFALVALLAFAEAHFGVVVATKEITRENVDSVSGFAAFIRRRLVQPDQPTRGRS